jgi:hypothetical protein
MHPRRRAAKIAPGNRSGTDHVNRIANVSTPKDKKGGSAGESPIQKQKPTKEKLIKLDDLIPKRNVAGGRQWLFGATDINQTTNRKRR